MVKGSKEEKPIVIHKKRLDHNGGVGGCGTTLPAKTHSYAQHT
jgi:hypothetical protein